MALLASCLRLLCRESTYIASLSLSPFFRRWSCGVRAQGAQVQTSPAVWPRLRQCELMIYEVCHDSALWPAVCRYKNSLDNDAPIHRQRTRCADTFANRHGFRLADIPLSFLCFSSIIALSMRHFTFPGFQLAVLPLRQLHDNIRLHELRAGLGVSMFPVESGVHGRFHKCDHLLFFPQLIASL